MEQIIYRTINENDMETVIHFLSGIQGIHLHENGEDSVEGMISYLARNPELSFLATDNERIVGVIFCGHDGRRGFINHLAVAPDFRHKGVASKLIHLTEERLKNLGIKKEALFVLNENESAMAFYEKTGWQEEKIVKIYCKLL